MRFNARSRGCSIASRVDPGVNPTRLVLLGDPVARSLSPVFQNAALRAAGIDIRYEALRVSDEDLPQVAGELAHAGAAGNVTIPHKRAFLELCADVTPIASRVGAVNTFWTSAGRLAGDNTDVAGFDAAARKAVGDVRPDLRIALFGAGGAAAAVLGAVERWPGARVRIYGRRPGQAAELAARFHDFAREESTPSSALRGANIVVNATPVGMSDDAMPFEPGNVPPGATIIDLVYRRGGTSLTRSAAAAGYRAVDGSEMLVEQGALSFERWFGFPPDRQAMRDALR